MFRHLGSLTSLLLLTGCVPAVAGAVLGVSGGGGSSGGGAPATSTSPSPRPRPPAPPPPPPPAPPPPSYPAGTALRFVTQPTTVAPGRRFEPRVRVGVVDASGGVMTVVTASITVELWPAPGNGATLTGGTPTTTVDGVATFPTLSLDRRGSGYTLRAHTSGLAAAVSRAFDVLPDVDFAASRTVAVDGRPAIVRTADFDGDGVLDLFLGYTWSHQVSYRSGLGSGRFGPQTTLDLIPQGTFNLDARVLDLDEDGVVDVLVVNSGSNNVCVLLGQGDGTLAAPVYHAVGTNPQHGVGVGDFDEDGHVDVATGNAFADSVSLLFGDGLGGFARRVDVSVGGQPHAVDAADLDGDGHLDLAVAARLGGVATLLRGDGAGGFAASGDVAVGSGPRHLRLVDLSGDGQPDLLIVNEFDQDVRVLLGLGGFSFGAAEVHELGSIVGYGDVADLDLDGDLDLAVPTPDGLLRVFTNDGAGSFGAPTILPSAGNGRHAFADLQGDGRPDLVFAYDSDLGATGVVRQVVQLFDNTRDGLFVTRTYSTLDLNPRMTSLGDHDADGVLDLAITYDFARRIGLCRGRGDGSFDAEVSLTVPASPRAVAHADLDLDTRPDIVVTCFASPGFVTVLRDDGSGLAATSYGAGDAPQDLALGDVNGDGLVDALVTNVPSGADDHVSVLLGDGTGALGTPTTVATGEGTSCLELADLDGDGDLDLVVGNDGTNTVSVWPGAGDGTFGAPTTYASSGTGLRSLAVGDVDGDGDLDVVVSHATSETLTLLRGEPGGALTAGVKLADAGAGLGDVQVADLDGDGALDIVATNELTRDVSVLVGLGGGTFRPERRFSVRRGAHHTSIGDIDRDGRPDLVVANRLEQSFSVLLGR